MTTKYDIGQQVWCVSEDMLFKATIEYITISDHTDINYLVSEYDDEFPEDSVFDNPIDATYSWLAKNNLTIDADMEHLKAKVVAYLKSLESN